MISVLIADDHTIVRRSILSILAGDPRVRVVGEASDFSQAIEKARTTRPDVIVLDLHMPCDPDLSIRDICTHLNSCGAQVLGVSFAYDDDAKSLARSIGAAELLDKIKLGTDLIPSIVRLASTSNEFLPAVLPKNQQQEPLR